MTRSATAFQTFRQRLADFLAPSPVEGVAPTPSDLADVTDFADQFDLAALDVLTWTPAWLSRAERLMIFTLIFSLRPRRYLEIGTFQGGSALLTVQAMDLAGTDGRVFCVDPEPKIKPEHWERIQHRATMFQGFSPDILPDVYAESKAPLDFVFIDGDHTYEGVVRDAYGVMPYVARGSYLLFHDCFFPDVKQGLDDFVQAHRKHLVDLGPITRETTVQRDPDRPPIPWGGLRLMQVR